MIKSKKILYLIIVLLIVISGIFTASCESDPKPLIENGGFEKVIKDTTPKKWIAKNATTTNDSSHVKDGKRAGKVAANGELKYELTDLSKNTNYRFSAHIKVGQDNAKATLGVKVSNDTMDEEFTNTAYEEKEIVFNTGSQTKATVYLLGDDLIDDQKAYIDVAKVEEYFKEEEVEVSLNIDSFQLAIGDKYPLLATVTPSSATEKDVKYTSNPEGIVSIDENGVITGEAAGKTTITVEPVANGSSVTTEITVTETKQPWYPNSESHEWKLTKEDNFEGTELDLDLWTIRGKEYATYHRDDLVEVSDGKLKLGIEREENGDLVLGRVDTQGEGLSDGEAKFEQKYGFFEVSVNIPPVEETYFAFWTMNYPGTFNVSGGAREGAEIDVTETVYKADLTESVIHYDGYDEHHKSVGSRPQQAPKIHDGFHVFGLEWDEDYLKFYFDGQLTWEVRDKNVIPLVNEIFILSSGWARSAGWGDGNKDNADLPFYSEVDWFRAYERVETEPKEDTTKPLFYGVDDIEIPLNSNYDMSEKVFAIDNVDDMEELTKTIVVDESDLQRDKEGSYIVKYFVKDAAGNSATVDRSVTVVPVDENQPKELITNGTFDKDHLDDWTFEQGFGEVRRNIDQGKFVYLNNTTKMTQHFDVEPHTTYELSYRSRLETKFGDQELFVGVNYDGEKKQSQTTLSNWTNEIIQFTTGPNDHSATFFVENNGVNGAFFDNISIVKVPLDEAGENLNNE